QDTRNAGEILPPQPCDSIALVGLQLDAWSKSGFEVAPRHCHRRRRIGHLRFVEFGVLLQLNAETCRSLLRWRGSCSWRDEVLVGLQIGRQPGTKRGGRNDLNA